MPGAMFSIRSPGKTENLQWGRGHRTPAPCEQSARGGPRCHWEINNDLFLRRDTSRKVRIYSRSNNMTHFANCVWTSGKINMVSVMFPSELEICFIRHDPRENVRRENISSEGTERPWSLATSACIHRAFPKLIPGTSPVSLCPLGYPHIKMDKHFPLISIDARPKFFPLEEEMSLDRL